MSCLIRPATTSSTDLQALHLGLGEIFVVHKTHDISHQDTVYQEALLTFLNDKTGHDILIAEDPKSGCMWWWWWYHKSLVDDSLE